MEIKITNTEETASTHYFAVDLEVVHEGKEYEVSATLIKNYDNNCGHCGYEVVVELTNPSASELTIPKEERDNILGEVDGYVRRMAGEIDDGFQEVN